MGDMTGLELFATKGIEYLLIIGYLALLIPAWIMLTRRQPGERQVAVRTPRQSWFAVPEGLYFHPGHTWAQPEDGGIMRVGLDEFGGKLIGEIDSIDLPKPGTALRAGDIGWRLKVGDSMIDVLSPVQGTVVAVNVEAQNNPAVLHEDPYKRGWLLEVEVPEKRPVLSSLMAGTLADAWMQDSIESLQHHVPDELGITLQDGGIPVVGLARAIDPEHWLEIATELLRSPKADDTPNR